MQGLRKAQRRDVAHLLLLAAVWGSSFMSIEVALHWLSPWAIAAGRVLLAAIALLALLKVLRQPLPRGLRDWSLCSVIGLLNTLIPFALISWGQQFITSARSAILIASGPFIALLLAHVFTRDDRLSLLKIAGVGLGFSGVLMLIGGDALRGDEDAVIGQLAVAAAALCYSVSSLLTRKLGHMPVMSSTTAMMLAGAVAGLPLLFASNWPAKMDWTAAFAVLWLALFPTALAYLLRVRLIQQVGTTFTSQVAYLIPPFAVLWGWVFLAERPAPAAWLALGLTLAGIAVSRMRWGKQSAADQSAPK
jgi:drug/metabolite transporter (DMT)-like permease